eukprot:TRINITY_DN23663_c0_g1_i2.p1 TRINITY_DN23663_c0_g1~~TRINITY_DN23663_c0_g1_i2.p1  ORF type:complete len:273 (-),score=14.48 TRINITY_DN23663_c0_g1_i2:23-730(-)
MRRRRRTLAATALCSSLTFGLYMQATPARQFCLQHNHPWRRCHRDSRLSGARGASSLPCGDVLPEDLAAVLRFWFGDEYFDSPESLDEVAHLKKCSKLWYRGGAKADEAAKRFLPKLLQETADAERANDGCYWLPDPNVSQLQCSSAGLARIVLFDQISRNVMRGTASAFSQDGFACDIAERLIAKDFHKRCRAAELLCLTQPLVHSEGMPRHLRGRRWFRYREHCYPTRSRFYT